VALASATAGAARRYILGLGPLFPVPQHEIFIGPQGLAGKRKHRLFHVQTCELECGELEFRSGHLLERSRPASPRCRGLRLWQAELSRRVVGSTQQANGEVGCRRRMSVNPRLLAQVVGGALFQIRGLA
jgi:hypothetical protein